MKSRIYVSQRWRECLLLGGGDFTQKKQIGALTLVLATVIGLGLLSPAYAAHGPMSANPPLLAAVHQYCTWYGLQLNPAGTGYNSVGQVTLATDGTNLAVMVTVGNFPATSPRPVGPPAPDNTYSVWVGYTTYTGKGCDPSPTWTQVSSITVTGGIGVDAFTVPLPNLGSNIVVALNTSSGTVYSTPLETISTG